MKNILFYLTILLLSVIAVPATGFAQTYFQRHYGTALNNTFSKVIAAGSNYFVVGSNQTTSGGLARATVSYMNAQGQLQWTRTLDNASVWNDAMLTMNGNLLVVGNTLPADANNQSLMGVITPAGAFLWVRSYNVTGREGFQKVARNPTPQNTAFPYYVLGLEYEQNNIIGSASWDNVTLQNINELGTVNWKRRYQSNGDDEFVRDFTVLQNGNLLMAGSSLTTTGTPSGVLYQIDNTGAVTSGSSISSSISYRDLTPVVGGGFYAVASNTSNSAVYFIRYNASLNPVWSVTLSNMTFISQIWVEGGTNIYVSGTGTFNNLSRAVLLRFTDNGAQPSLNWARFLDNGETQYAGGDFWYLMPNRIAFADGRVPAAGGFGLQEAFLSISDLQLTSCMTKSGAITISNAALPPGTPATLTNQTVTAPTWTAVTSSLVSWQQETVVCKPCDAQFTSTNLDNCGSIQFNNQSTGAQTIQYTWNFGDPASGTANTSNSPTPKHLYAAAGVYTVTLAITSADGCTDTYSTTVQITSGTYPPTVVCPANLIVSIPANSTTCSANVILPVTQFKHSACAIKNDATVRSDGQPLNAAFPKGETTVTCTATDQYGTSSCSYTVLVVDKTPPTLTCPQNVAALALPGETDAKAYWQAPVYSDNCPGVTILGLPSGSRFPCGVNTVNYVATDASGNTKSCSFKVTVTCNEGACSVQTNNCLDFDGQNDRVTVNSPLTTTALMNNFSVGCWFRNQRTSGANFYRIFGWSSATNRFEVGDANGFLSFHFPSNGNASNVSTTNIRDGQWHYVVAVKSGNLVTIYLDGVAVPNLTNINAGNFINLGATYRIGDWAGSTGTLGDSEWQGRVDEFKIWNMALSPAQVRSAQLCGANTANTALITYFDFDQGIAGGNNANLTTVVNRINGGANGTLATFTLNGAASNWVGVGVSPACSAVSYNRMEGDANRNIPGLTKVYESDVFTIGTEGIGANTFATFTRRRADGNIAWRTRFGIQSTITDFVRTDEGCFLLVGYTPSYTDGNQSFIAKVEDDGDVVWLKTYNLHANREGFFQIIRSANPAEANFPYIVTGYMRNSSGLRDDVVLFSINSIGQAGNLRKQIGTTSDDEEFGFDLVSWNNRHILAGKVWLGTTGATRGVLLMTDNQGNVQASGTVMYQNGVTISQVQPLSSQFLLIAGSIGGNGLLAKVDANGNQVWAQRFSQIKDFHSVTISPATGDIYAVGVQVGATNNQNAIVCIRDNGTSASFQWQRYPKILGEQGVHTPGYIAAYGWGNLFYTDGRHGKASYPAEENILAVMRDNNFSNGCTMFPSEPTPSVTAVTLTRTSYNPAVANTIFPTPIPSTTGTPLALNTLDPCLGGNLDEEGAGAREDNAGGWDQPSTALEIMLYPNPTMGECTVEWPEALSADAQALILDAAGRLTLQVSVPAGSTRLNVDLSAHPDGMYFVQIQAPDRSVKISKLLKVNP